MSNVSRCTWRFTSSEYNPFISWLPSGGKKFPRASLYCISGHAVSWICVFGLFCFLNLEILHHVWSANGTFLLLRTDCLSTMLPCACTLKRLLFQSSSSGFSMNRRDKSPALRDQFGEQDHYQTIKKQYRQFRASQVTLCLRICGSLQKTKETESGISPGVRNGNPLQYSFLENSMDRGACPRRLQSMELQSVGHDWVSKYA